MTSTSFEEDLIFFEDQTEEEIRWDTITLGGSSIRRSPSSKHGKWDSKRDFKRHIESLPATKTAVSNTSPLILPHYPTRKISQILFPTPKRRISSCSKVIRGTIIRLSTSSKMAECLFRSKRVYNDIIAFFCQAGIPSRSRTSSGRGIIGEYSYCGGERQRQRK